MEEIQFGNVIFFPRSFVFKAKTHNCKCPIFLLLVVGFFACLKMGGQAVLKSENHQYSIYCHFLFTWNLLLSNDLVLKEATEEITSDLLNACLYLKSIDPPQRE